MPHDEHVGAEVQRSIVTLLLYTVQLCVSVLMDTLTASEPSEATNTPQAEPVPASLKSRTWTDQEMSDLVDYLHEHRSEGTGGNFKKATFNHLSRYLAERHDQIRTVEAIQAKFRTVRIS